jgi:hypothetical protein
MTLALAAVQARLPRPPTPEAHLDAACGSWMWVLNTQNLNLRILRCGHKTDVEGNFPVTHGTCLGHDRILTGQDADRDTLAHSF